MGINVRNIYNKNADFSGQKLRDYVNCDIMRKIFILYDTDTDTVVLRSRYHRRHAENFSAKEHEKVWISSVFIWFVMGIGYKMYTMFCIK